MPAEDWNLEVGSWHETYLAVLQAETNDDRSTRNSITSLRSRSLRASDDRPLQPSVPVKWRGCGSGFAA